MAGFIWNQFSRFRAISVATGSPKRRDCAPGCQIILIPSTVDRNNEQPQEKKAM